MRAPVPALLMSLLALVALAACPSPTECRKDADCAERGPDIVCRDAICVQDVDDGPPDGGDAPDGGDEEPPGGGDDGGDEEEAPGAAELRITEVDAARVDRIELVAVVDGMLDGISLIELTNSDFSFDFPAGYSVEVGDVIVLHLGGDCSDSTGNRASCGASAPFHPAALDLSMPGSLSYSGKVFVLLAADGAGMDGVPFVEASGLMPGNQATAVQLLQSERLWDPTPCVHDMDTGFAKDRYCRNISVDWTGLSEGVSVMRIVGPDALAVPGNAGQWSGPLPSTWGRH